MKKDLILCLLAALLLAAIPIAPDALAGEPGGKVVAPPVPPDAWRPYTDLKTLLLFEGFEGDSNLFTKGKVADKGNKDVEQDASGQVPPSAHCLKLEAGNNIQVGLLNLAPYLMRMPHGLDPKQINIQFSIYLSEDGSVIIKAVPGDFTETRTISKPKSWIPVTLRMSDLANKAKSIEPNSILSAIEITAKGRGKDKNVTAAYIDDVMITYAMTPRDLFPKLALSVKKKQALEKVIHRDGFFFSQEVKDSEKAVLKTAAKYKKKPGFCLVAGPTPEATKNIVEKLNANAQKPKDITYVAAVDWNGEPGGGLDFIRTMMQWNLAKSEVMNALLIVGSEDMGVSRPTECVKAIVDRAEAFGVSPVFVVPNMLGADDKSKIFNGILESVCHQSGVAWIDGSFLLRGPVVMAVDKKGEPKEPIKDTRTELSPKDFTGPGEEKFITHVLAAMKHIKENATKD